MAAGVGSGSGRVTEKTDSSRASTRLVSEKVGLLVTKGTLRMRGSCLCRGGLWPLNSGAVAPHSRCEDMVSAVQVLWSAARRGVLLVRGWNARAVLL